MRAVRLVGDARRGGRGGWRRGGKGRGDESEELEGEVEERGLLGQVVDGFSAERKLVDGEVVEFLVGRGRVELVERGLVEEGQRREREGRPRPVDLGVGVHCRDRKCKQVLLTLLRLEQCLLGEAHAALEAAAVVGGAREVEDRVRELRREGGLGQSTARCVDQGRRSLGHWSEVQQRTLDGRERHLGEMRNGRRWRVDSGQRVECRATLKSGAMRAHLDSRQLWRPTCERVVRERERCRASPELFDADCSSRPPRTPGRAF